MRPAVHIHIMRDLAHAAVAPLVKDQPVVQIDAHAVVGQDMEAVGSRIKVSVALPARREIVRGEAIRRTAASPIEVNRPVVAHKGRRAAQLHVGIVLTPPFGIASRLLPPNAHLGDLPRIIVFHTDVGRAGVQPLLRAVGARRGIMPLVNQQFPVHPHAHTIISLCIEPISSRREEDRPRPARREEVAGHIAPRRPVLPVKIHARVIAHQDRRPCQRRIGIVLPAPTGHHRRARRRRGHSGRLRRRHRRRDPRIIRIRARQPPV